MPTKQPFQIVGGEQYILSAVMHADEINPCHDRSTGREVCHYHLHVVCVPVVEKQITLVKTPCKDKGTGRHSQAETVTGQPGAEVGIQTLLDESGKPVFAKERSLS